MTNDFEGLIAPPQKAHPLRATPNSRRRMSRTRWAWYPFIPLGEITIITGPTDVGKSTVCLDIAGALTRGKLKGEFEDTPVNVAYVALEDTIETDITPKLVATDADRDLFWDMEKKGGLYLPEALDEMQEIVDQTSAKVIFLDPISSVIRGDHNKSDIVRPALEELREFAAKNRIAFVSIRHQRKGNSGGATEGVSGSVDWVNISRCSVAIREHREQPGHFVMSITKNNRVAREERINLLYTFEHRPVDIDDGEGVQMTPKIKWLGETGLSVDDMMQDAANGIRAGESSDAAAWLEAYLADNGGEAEKAEIDKAARAAGVSPQGIAAARDRLSLATDVSTGTLVWSLPGRD